MKHVFIIKQGDATSFIPSIHEVMKDYDYDIRYSTYPHECESIIKKYIEKTRFYSVGGDGFLNQVIQTLIHTSHELVLIPMGTGNDFSRVVNSSKDPKKILKDSLLKEATLIDTMKVNNLYSINSICFGLDSVIANTVHNVDAGKFSYILSILRNITHYPYHKVKVNDKEYRVLLCTIMNGRYYGGGFNIAPDSLLEDGLLDFVLLEKIKKREYPYYIYKILTKKLEGTKKSHYLKVRDLVIETNVSCNVDGEEIKDTTYHIQVIPHSLLMVK